MKILIYTFLFLFISPLANAQMGSFSKEELSKKVVVVLGEIPEFDEGLKDAVKKHWKLSQYTFISKADISKYNENEFNYLFIFRVDKTISQYQNSQNARIVDLNYFMIILAPKYKEPTKYGNSDNIRVSFQPYELGSNNYYKAESLKNIKILHEYSSALLNKEIKGFGDFDDYIQKKFNSSILENKTLLIDTSGIEFKKSPKLITCYPYKITYVSKKEIDDAIVNGSQDIIYYDNYKLDLWGFNYFMEASSGNILYYKLTNSRFNLNCSLLEEIIKKTK
jgi:hypothetical protein